MKTEGWDNNQYNYVKISIVFFPIIKHPPQKNKNKNVVISKFFSVKFSYFVLIIITI